MSTSHSPPANNVDIGPSLDRLIDPSADETDHLQALENVAHAHAITKASEAAGLSQPQPQAQTQPQASSSANASNNMLPKPKRTLVRGSAADFRRREANRLAADRSRIRATEKRTSLEATFTTLTEDNARLKAEIEKLERDAGHVDLSMQMHMPGLGMGMDHVAEGESSNDAQDSHSRTILAALMSAGQHETFESDMAQALDGVGVGVGAGDDSWMQGMEDMLKDAETSGRLGELARLAAGRNGPPGQEGGAAENDTPQEEATTTTAEVPAQAPDEEPANPPNAQPQTADPQIDPALDKEGETPARKDETAPPAQVVLKKIDYNPEAALAAASSKIAVTLNADMEKIIRDELAVTKAVLASVNKEIARLEALNEEERKSDPAKRDPERLACLPNEIFSDNGEALKLLADSGKAEVEVLEAKLPEYRGKVRAARTEKLEEEARLAKLVMELQKVSVGGKRGVDKVLKGVGGYVGQLLGTTQDSAVNDEAATGSSYLSAAFARRRRGRPPKFSGPANPPDHHHIPGLSTSAAEQDPDDPTNPKHLKSRSRLVQRLAEAFQISQAAEEGRSEDASARETQFLAQLQKGIALEDMLDATRAEHNGEGGEDGEPKESIFSRWKKGPPGSCDVCGRTETTVWRKLKFGEDNLKVCNPCGLYHAKFHVIRPPELWGDGKNIKKRRALTRARKSEGEEGGQGKKKRRKGSDEGMDGDDAAAGGSGDVTEGGEGVGESSVHDDAIDPALRGEVLDPATTDAESAAAQAKEVAALNEAILGGARDADVEDVGDGVGGIEGLEGGPFDEGHLLLEMEEA